MDVDFAVSRPLVRPGLPHIRFLFVRSRICSTLLSDPASRRRPCALLALHLHQVVRGTCTPKLSNMLGTQLNRSAVDEYLSASQGFSPSSRTSPVCTLSMPSSSLRRRLCYDMINNGGITCAVASSHDPAWEKLPRRTCSWNPCGMDRFPQSRRPVA